MALKIYGVSRSRATRPLWLARELGLAYEQVPVIQSYRLPDPAAPGAPLNTASPEFLAINPAGQVPSIDDDGFILHESLAITLYLARRHGGPLAARDAREEARMVQWSFWAATGMETEALAVQMHLPAAAPKHDPARAAAAVAALRRPFAVLEQALRAGGGHLVGGRFTVADLNVAEIVRYAQPAKDLFAGFPAVQAWIAACQSRPAFQAMMAEREKEPA